MWQFGARTRAGLYRVLSESGGVKGKFQLILTFVVPALLASPSSAQYLFSYLPLNDGVSDIDSQNARVTDSGIVAVQFTSASAGFYELATGSFSTLSAPPGKAIDTVMGRTTTGQVAVKLQGDQGCWYYDGSAWQNPLLHSGDITYSFNDQNESTALAAGSTNPPSGPAVSMTFAWTVETALTSLNARNPRISANGYAAGDDPTAGNGGFLWDPSLNAGAGAAVTLDINAIGVNASGDTAGINPSDGLMYFYNHSSGSYTLIPELAGKGIAAGYNYTIVGLSDADEVIGLVARDQWTRSAFYYSPAVGTADLTSLIGPASVPADVDLAEMFNDFSQLTDINAGGVIAGRAQLTSGPEYESFVLTPLSGDPVPKNPGDAMEDGFVGADDLVRILSNWGQTDVAWSDGDVSPYNDGFNTGDNFVGADDYVAVLTVWGTDYNSSEPIPEPATLGLLVLAASVFLRRRR